MKTFIAHDILTSNQANIANYIVSGVDDCPPECPAYEHYAKKHLPTLPDEVKILLNSFTIKKLWEN
jgi:hypothetical protein